MEIINVSENIKLVPVKESDAEQLFQLIDSQREYFGEWLPFVKSLKSFEDERTFLQSTLSAPEETRSMIYCILYENSIIGLISLMFHSTDKANKRAEIGYWISENFQKKGIMTNCAKTLITYAFTDLELNRVQIRCAVGNTKSRNIPKRLGFTYEGTERDGELLSSGNFTDIEVYSILKKEWK